MSRDLEGGVTLAERGILDAFRAGRAWTPTEWLASHQQGDAEATGASAADPSSSEADAAAGIDPNRPIFRAEILRAAIIVDGCIARGIEPPEEMAHLLLGAEERTDMQRSIRGIEIKRVENGPGSKIRPQIVCPADPDGGKGVFDLTGVIFPKRIALMNCDFIDETGQRAIVRLDDAKIGSLDLTGSKMGMFDADQLVLDGDFEAAEIDAVCINLRGARLGGWLRLAKAKLNNPEGNTFIGNSARLEGDFRAYDGFTSTGLVNLHRMWIGGSAWFDGARLYAGAKEVAFTAASATIRGDFGLYNEAEIKGETSFSYCEIGGTLMLSNALFDSDGRKNAIKANNSKIKGSVLFSPDARARGCVDFFEAEIAGSIEAAGAEFDCGEAGRLAFNAHAASIGGHVLMRNKLTATGEINFGYCHIGGTLDLSNASLREPGLDASEEALEAAPDDKAEENEDEAEAEFVWRLLLDANTSQIGGGVFLDNLDVDGGSISFVSAKIAGGFRLQNAEVASRHQGLTLSLAFVKAQGELLINNANFDNAVTAVKCRFASNCQILGSSFKAVEGARALDLGGAQFGGSLTISDQCSFEGELEIQETRVERAVQIRRTSFSTLKEKGFAIRGYGLSTGDDVDLGPDLDIKGMISLRYATIGQSLRVFDSVFERNGAAVAWNAFGATIGSDLYVSGNTFEGSFYLPSVSVGGGIDIEDCVLKGDKGAPAFAIRGAHLATKVEFQRNKAHGTVDLAHIKVSGNVDFLESEITLPDGLKSDQERVMLDLEAAQIAGALMFDDPYYKENRCVQVEGNIDLSHARCEVLDDRPLGRSGKKRWLRGKLFLDGFVYERLGARAPKRADQRREWLQRQPLSDKWMSGFKPQPYEQLTKVLREMGFAGEARSIAVSKQWRMHWSLLANWRSPRAYLSFIFRLFVMWPTGYGYRPEYPFAMGVAAVLLSYGVFEAAYRNGYMEPAQPHLAIAEIERSLDALNPDIALEAPPDCAQFERSEVVPPFNGLIYAIDTFVPLIDLDQESSWKPAINSRPCLDGIDEINPPPGWWTAGEWPRETLSAYVERTAPERRLYWIKWLVMTAGFAISALIAASLSGLLRRD